jgi:excisionase family DNA binding protein
VSETENVRKYSSLFLLHIPQKPKTSRRIHMFLLSATNKEYSMKCNEHPFSPEYISVSEAARIIGVSARSVYSYIATGRLTAIRVGTLMLVHAEEVARFERPVADHRRKRKSAAQPSREAPAPKHKPLSLAGYLSVREAARRVGVSPRSMYGYLARGKLTAIRVGDVVVVDAEEVAHCQRQGVGRRRERHPLWRVPLALNRQYMTLIRMRVREGEGERLEQRLEEIRAAKKHHLVGTVARSVMRNQHDPTAIQILLVWRQLVMPAEEERQAALAALRADLADLLDWEHATWSESQVLLHAEG